MGAQSSSKFRLIRAERAEKLRCFSTLVFQVRLQVPIVFVVPPTSGTGEVHFRSVAGSVSASSSSINSGGAVQYVVR